MSTLNVGAMAARLGLDPSDFLEKMKGVQGFNAFATGEMKRQWKESSREGAESLRLIDESLGIHISRPITRILTQEFPGLAKGLQSILGVGVVGALGGVAIEVGEKIAKSFEKAKKAQEDFQQSTEKLKTTFEDIEASYAGSEKLRSLSGLSKTLFQIDTSSLERVKKQLDELTAAAEANAAAAEKASGIWNTFGAKADDMLHAFFSSDSQLGVEKINKKYDEIKQHIADIKNENVGDPTAGLQKGLEYLNQQAAAAKKSLDDMKAHPLNSAEEIASTAIRISRPAKDFGKGPGLSGFSAAEIQAEDAALSNINQLIVTLNQNLKGKQGDDDAAKRVAALALQAKSLEAIKSLQSDIGSSLAKLAPEDPFAKLESQISEMRIKAENDFSALQVASHNALSPLQLATAENNLAEFEDKLDRVLQKAKMDADVAAAQKGLPALFSSTAQPQIIAQGATPTLTFGQGGSQAEQFKTFSNDIAAQSAMVTKAFEEALTPEQKQKLALDELNLSFSKLPESISKSVAGQAALAAATQQITEQTTKADLELIKLRNEMQKLLEKSTEAGAGVQAFWKQLQIEGSQNAQFSFDVLNKAVKGFEDNLANAIVSGTRNWKREWASLAKDLETTTLKFSFTKAISGIGGEIGKTGIGQRIGGLFGKGKQDGGEAANTTAVTANTSALGANTAALSAAAAKAGASGGFSIPGIGGGGGSAAAGDEVAGGASDIPFYADGGDVTPGGRFIAGEAGAEEIDLNSGGAHVTPLGKGGGDVHHHYDMRGAVVTDDLMRKADAARMMSMSERRTVQSSASMQREIGLRKRPG